MKSCNCNPGPLDPHVGCGSPRNRCDPPCQCPVPYLGVSELPDNISVLRFNINGKRTDYDYRNLVEQTQTDTTLVADVISRLLVYTAERHTDTISAKELGAILHLVDLGDVSGDHLKDGSFLTYQKSNNCGEGCTGTTDTWKAWNALDEQISSATYPFAFDANGKPHVLERPENPNQYYQLSWNAGNQLSYSQLPIVDASRVVGTDGKKIAVYQDPISKQLVGVKQ